MTDADLVSATRSGSLEAFATLVRRHQDTIYAFVRSRTPDGAAAEDIAQEVFIAAHRGLGTLAEPGRVLPWLLGIARHKVLEQRRAAARRPDLGGGADLDALPARAAAADPEAVLAALFEGLPD